MSYPRSVSKEAVLIVKGVSMRRPFTGLRVALRVVLLLFSPSYMYVTRQETSWKRSRNLEDGKALLSPGFHAAIFSSRFLDGLSEKGTSRSLAF